MKNNLIIDQKLNTIIVLNIPNDYPLVIIQYKSGKDVFIKSFVVRGIKPFTLKNKDNFKFECIVSFFKDINIHTTFIPSHLIDVVENSDTYDKLICYLSMLLSLNDKTSPNDEIDLDLYQLKKKNILLNLGKDKLEIGGVYNIIIDDFPIGNHKIIDIQNDQIKLRHIETSIDIIQSNIIIDLIDILYLNIEFERID